MPNFRKFVATVNNNFVFIQQNVRKKKQKMAHLIGSSKTIVVRSDFWRFASILASMAHLESPAPPIKEGH
jgi:hypothetical protein